MVDKADIEAFARIYNYRIQAEQKMIAEGITGNAQRDHIIFRLGYREAFEVLTRNDPEMRDAVLKLIPEEWG